MLSKDPEYSITHSGISMQNESVENDVLGNEMRCNEWSFPDKRGVINERKRLASKRLNEYNGRDVAMSRRDEGRVTSRNKTVCLCNSFQGEGKGGGYTICYCGFLFFSFL